jgi:TPR repeat protein
MPSRVTLLLSSTLWFAQAGLADVSQELALGRTAWFEGRHTEAVAHWRRLAATGHPQAQLYLAYAYRVGRGVARDPAVAARWYRAAAEQGVAVAQYELGLMYEVGRGVASDPDEATYWYGQALGQGYCPSELSAGGMLGDR